MSADITLNLISQGFKSLKVDEVYKKQALVFLKQWLTQPMFSDYVGQIEYLTEQKKWDLLLDCFYQIIPFGTGGRRGLVGIGPNRINPWTIQSSAQGHSQYLLDRFGESAKKRGIVIAYDVRQYLKKGEYNDKIINPINNLSCLDLARQAACVYAANGIKVHLFSTFTSTPELSFMVRRLKAVAGDMISASHNPPEFNGKKVVDETGGQLIPPYDQQLVDVVVNDVKAIKVIDYDQAIKQKLITIISKADHQAYIQAASQTALTDFRNAKIYFSPFCGTASRSVFPVLQMLGFNVQMDAQTGKPDPLFSAITFNIPNPEVEQAYQNLIPKADKVKADIILTTDPDADRIGLMSKEGKKWRYYNGNEIMSLCVSFILEELKNKGDLKKTNVLIKTLVTTNFITALAKAYDVQIIADLLVGIKYIANEINKLEINDRIRDFLLGGEESHGMVMGNYLRDKDSCVPAILLSELASKLKSEGKTLGQYLDELYLKFGFFRNYLTEIRLPGAEGMSNIAKIQDQLRANPPKTFGKFQILKIDDRWQGEKFKSETDRVSRNVLTFHIKPNDSQTQSLMVTIRPSGTEPKTKPYIEIGRKPIKNGTLATEKKAAEVIKDELEREVLKYCYKIIGYDLPDRSFLLFWQMPITDKAKYFEVEAQIAALKTIENRAEKETQLNALLGFLGSNPIEKINEAFRVEYGKGVRDYIGL